MGSFKDLIVYKKAFELAMCIFEITRSFPKEETYSLIDQYRRSSRSVCTNIAEAYRKRRYPAHFISKITDADMENSETDVWNDFALKCGYENSRIHKEIDEKNKEIGKLLGHMIENPDKYGR
jgi:four helix bundle protein